MEYVKSCLFIDFDNVYSGLENQSPVAARTFAANPELWLEWLENYGALTEDKTPRKVLVRKCYMNPQAFARFRPYFVKSSFQVVDCPPLTEQGKNAADIHMAVDMLGYLDHRIDYDEFIVMSSDSDFTPVLVKLREYDKSTFVVSTGFSSVAFRNSADIVMDQVGFIDILESLQEAGGIEKPILSARKLDEAALAAEIAEFAKGMIKEHGNQIVSAGLASAIRSKYAKAAGIDTWFGKRKFSDFLLGLGIPNLEIDATVPGYVRIGEGAPVEKAPACGGFLERLHQILDVPVLPAETYSAFFEELKAYTSAHAYSLTECSKSLRDAMVKKGFPFSRGAANFILIGLGRKNVLKSAAADVAVYREAFFSNVQGLMDAAQVNYAEDDLRQLRRMLGLA